MLSLRVTRDRRGYEHIYLVNETRHKGRSDARILYWTRRVPGLRVGRDPFDEQTRAVLEKAYPQVAFDWAGLVKSLQSSTATARYQAYRQRSGAPSGALSPAPKPDVPRPVATEKDPESIVEQLPTSSGDSDSSE